MDNDFFSAMQDLEDDLSTVSVKNTDPKYARKQFQCEACGGTGRWIGGTNRHGNHKCNTCHGKGFLVTSPEARAKARKTARNNKAKQMLQAQEANKAHGEGFLYDWLRSIREWNTFAESLLVQHAEGREWSDKQVEDCRRMYSKMKAKEDARKEQAKVAPVVDLSSIRAMFDSVVAKGFKRPKYRAEGFVISLAPAHGVNAGALYVKSADDCYMGKLVGKQFHASRDAEGTDVQSALQAIAADPLGAAVRYGNATGRCACCGRELTNYESIKRGIGPICAERWGLGDVEWGVDMKAATEALNKELGK